MRVVVAGTFGPLHDGHRSLLEEALRQGDDGVVVGLTSDRFANRTRDREVPSFDRREEALREAVDELDRWGRDVEIRAIDDTYGVADEDPDLDAIVVSEETAEQVTDINERRVQRGYEPLEQVVVPMKRAEDGERISSTRIARGEIDVQGDLLE